MNKIQRNFKWFVNFGLIVALLAFLVGVPIGVVRASGLTEMQAILTTVTKSALANETILFTSATGVSAGQTITLTWDSDFSVPALLDYTDLDLSFDATPDGVCDTGDTEKTLGASASEATWGAVRTSGTVITFTSGTGTIAAGAEICVEIGTNAESQSTGVRQITNASTASSFNLAIGGTMTDSGTIVITTLNNDTVAVTATVPGGLTFAISDNDVFFGNLSTSAPKWADNTADGSASETAAHTLTASTNSTSGYCITINGATLASLGTPADTISAITGGAVDVTAGNGTEQFGLRLTASGGAGAVSSPYNGASNYYVFETGSLPDEVAASNADSATTTYSVFYAANIASSTEAHTDYAANLIYVATGYF